MDHNIEYMLLIREGSNWTFPKTYITDYEQPLFTAIRAANHAGLDVTSLFEPDSYFEKRIRKRTIGLYVIRTSLDTPIQYNLKNNIKEHRWFLHHRLTLLKYDDVSEEFTSIHWSLFSLALPLINGLRRYLFINKLEDNIISRSDEENENPEPNNPRQRNELNSKSKDIKMKINAKKIVFNI